jgi:hypothetical protein
VRQFVKSDPIRSRIGMPLALVNGVTWHPEQHKAIQAKRFSRSDALEPPGQAVQFKIFEAQGD